MQHGVLAKQAVREPGKGEMAARLEVRMVGVEEELQERRKVVVGEALRGSWLCSDLEHCERLGRRLMAQLPVGAVEGLVVQVQPEEEAVPWKWWTGEVEEVPLDWLMAEGVVALRVFEMREVVELWLLGVEGELVEEQLLGWKQSMMASTQVAGVAFLIGRPVGL